MPLGCGALKRSTKPKLYGGEHDSMSLSGGYLEAPIVVTRGGVRAYKLVVLGESGVGKSALTLQFVSHTFPEHHDPTIEESYQQQAVIDNEPAHLDILDTAGHIESTAIHDQYMRCGEGFMICYSITDRRSFQEVAEYRQLIQRTRLTESTPIILVGNKSDLDGQRKITLEEGKTLANQLGYPFFETSAALRFQIDEAFHALVREIRHKERKRAERNNAGKLSAHRRSRWWQLRSIFAFIFRRRQNNNQDNQ